jgi:gliding motility-associated-like protein
MRKIFLSLITLISLSVSSQLVVNEYSAANYDSYQDNYNEYEDWLELYNPTAIAIDISGYYLSDKLSNPTKWQVPSSFIVPANGVAVIFCSGRNEVSGGFAHTNFKITQTKGSEVFLLSDAAAVLLDSVSVRSNLKTHSRGREVNGSAIWSVFTNPTPNTANAAALQEYASTPIFSIPSGYYTTSAQVIITSPDPNITIYYTTDGSKPDNTSAQYTVPITFTQTTVLKAVAYSSTANIPPSFIEYNTYFVDDTHTIPILSISGNRVGDLLNGNASLEPEGTIEWFNKNGVLLDKGMGEYDKHGNDSWAYNQRGFDYVMRDQFGYNYALQDKVFTTKSRDKFQRLIVKAAANDNYPSSDGAHIRDAYVNHLSQLSDLRLDERSTSSCILYMNGNYWGVYEMREKVDDHDFTDYYYDQDKNNLQYLKTWGGTWTEYGAPNAQPDWDAFVAFVAANPMNIQANYNTAKSEFNTGSLIDYFLLNSYVVCADWLNWNTSWWRGMDPAGDKKKWRYTLWDMDNTFGHGANYTGIPSTGVNADPCDPSSLGNTGGQGHVPIWNEMLTNNDFFDEYVNRWQDLATTDLSCANMIDVLDSMIAVIEPEMPRQIATWGGNYATWQSNVQDMRDFILARCNTMNNGFLPCYPDLSGPFNVTVEIIGIGEVEMSDNLIINEINTPQNYSRFGGVDLPFEVKSGTFQYWEIVPAGTYVFDPFADTLSIELLGDVTVRAVFIPPTPTRDIVYKVEPAGTTTSIDVNGVNMNIFPSSINYTIGDTVIVVPQIDPLFGFSYWETDSVIMMPLNTNVTDSFYVNYHDTVVLHIYELPTIEAFISGNDSICDNDVNTAEVKVNFSGVSPYTFVYKHNGTIQDAIVTTLNPYIIETDNAGIYDLVSFSDANEVGGIVGQALVTVFSSPIANFHLTDTDTLNILDATTEFIDDSEGFIVSWQWDFGDNSVYDYTERPTHTYASIANLHTVSLIITDDNNCKDTTFRNIIIKDEYWIYIPNSFTPDNDQINDKFCISYNGIRGETFSFIIYDRFSNVVYSTSNILDLDCNNGWDGNYQETGTPLLMGTYVYEIVYKDFEGWKHQDFGNIFIIR